MRKTTSIFGMPAGIGSMPDSSNRASDRQSLASSRSPWTTCMSTVRWPSTDVVNISRAFVGVVGGRGVARNEHGDDPAERLDAERERGDVEQQHVRHAAREDVGLDRGAPRDHLVLAELT